MGRDSAQTSPHANRGVQIFKHESSPLLLYIDGRLAGQVPSVTRHWALKEKADNCHHRLHHGL